MPPRSTPRIALLALALLLVAGCAEAPIDLPIEAPIAQRLADAFLAKEPIGLLGDSLSLAEATAIQAAYVARLEGTLGPVVGYKAGLTSAAAQSAFQTDEPVRGRLLEAMIQPSGWSGPAAFGARPLFEGDLVVRVGNAAINEAETDLELLAALDAVFPFVELPDLMYTPGTAVDGVALTAINVGARLGVLGDAYPLRPDSATYHQLAAIRVVLVDEDETVIAEGTSAALLGHPLHVVRWLRDGLREEGQRLNVGDLLSLGSITPLVPVGAAPQRITARYWGLPSAPPDQPVAVPFTLTP